MSLTIEQVQKVAGLARLSLTDIEIASQTTHLNALLEQFEKLNELDVTGIEPTAHSVPIFNALRDDVAKPSLSRECALANAPEARDGCFIVPRILAG
ncbi:MAG: Asp-tRNA(Asn)/Glu-tRNA(Gln) amidotransferase subunit GatC [Chthonomonadales bacterium]